MQFWDIGNWIFIFFFLMERAPENLENQIQGKVTTLTGTPQITLIEHKPSTESHKREKNPHTKVEIQPGNQTVSPNYTVQNKTQHPNESRAGGATSRPPEQTHQDAAVKSDDAGDADQNPTPLAKQTPTVIDTRRRKAEKPTKPSTEQRRKEPSAAGGVRRRGRGRTNYMSADQLLAPIYTRSGRIREDRPI